VEPVRGKGAPADQVRPGTGVHDDPDCDKGQLVQAQRGHDAVVLQAEQQHLPPPRRGNRWTRGSRNGGRMTAEAGTLPAGAAAEAVPEPASDARPVGGGTGRKAIPTAPRPGGGVAQGQNRRGSQWQRRGARTVCGQRPDRGQVRARRRCADDPPRPRQDPRAKGGRWRETRCGTPLADLAQAVRRDVTASVCLQADNVRGQLTYGAAPYAFPWAWPVRPPSPSPADHSSKDLPSSSAGLSG